MLRADHECGVFLEGGNFERLVASTADHGSTHVQHIQGVTEMTRNLAAIIIIASFGVAGAGQAAGNAAAGKDKSGVCAGCHGDKGQGMGQAPALADKPDADLVKALKDFKSGSTNSVMHGLAASLSDQDIENLAAYYASLK